MFWPLSKPWRPTTWPVLTSKRAKPLLKAITQRVSVRYYSPCQAVGKDMLTRVAMVIFVLRTQGGQMAMSLGPEHGDAAQEFPAQAT